MSELNVKRRRAVSRASSVGAMLVAVLSSGSACKSRTSGAAAPDPAAADTTKAKPAEPQTPWSRHLQSPELPSLPPELEPVYSDVYAAIRSRLRKGRPSLPPPPLRGRADYRAWAHSEVDPWVSELGAIRTQISAIDPEAVAGAARMQAPFVHSQLRATLEANLFLIMMWSAEAESRSEPSGSQGSRAGFVLPDSMIGQCRVDRGGAALPGLSAWVDYCEALQLEIVAHTCEMGRKGAESSREQCLASAVAELDVFRAPEDEATATDTWGPQIDVEHEAVWLCVLAEDVMEDDEIASGDRTDAWLDEVHAAINSPQLLALTEEVLESHPPSRRASRLVSGIRERLEDEGYSCDAFDRLFSGTT